MKQSRKTNGQYSHKPRNIFTWRVGVLSVTILWCAVAGSYSNEDTTYTAEKQVVATSTPVIRKVLTTEEKIMQHFPRNGKTMIAVAHAESRMSMDAKGYNCYYNKDESIVYTTKVKGSHSRACKVPHRKYAWSVDCFVLQKNYRGQECPQGVTLDEHLQEVADLSRVQGLEAWSSYNDGKHLVYLDNN